MSKSLTFKILVIDDNPAIHEDFRKVFGAIQASNADIESEEAILFGGSSQPKSSTDFVIDSAYQGQQALERIKQALESNQPYAMAFVDIRMPPGWDGIETIRHIWAIDNTIQIVICTAYSDYSWEDIYNEFGKTDRILILKKPFDNIEVRQLAYALTEKWNLSQQVQSKLENLNELVEQRTRELEQTLALIKMILESTDDGILVLNNKNEVIYYNQKLLKLWDIPEVDSKQTIAIHLLELIKQQSEGFKQLFDTWSAYNPKKTEENFAEIQLNCGKIFEVYACFQQTSKNVLEKIWSFRDITTRKEAEEALKKTNERFQIVSRATHDIIWDWNLETGELWFNQNVHELFGYIEDEIGKDIQWKLAHIHPDEIKKITLSLQSINQSNTHTWSEEYRFLCKDGTYIYILDRGYIIRNDHGKAIRMIGAMLDISKRKEMEERLSFQATHDALTGLPNRLILVDHIWQAIANAKRNNNIFSVLFLDLDRFKVINDSLGHKIGDILLQEIARRLKQNTRQVDTVVRLGGDEFVIIMDQLNNEIDIIPRVHDLLSLIAGPIQAEQYSLTTTASIGISIYPKHGKTVDELLKNADSAMYAAKDVGGNNFEFYRLEMNSSAASVLEIESQLRTALTNNEFFLNYQPQFDLHTGKIIGVEALLRWHHPKLGNIQPHEFIPLAEEIGIITPIGEWVLKTACLQNKIWEKEGITPIPIAVNIASEQFCHKDMCDIVKNILNETGLKPHLLELELTESMLMQDIKSAIETMLQLKELGVKLAIDDFGTGYSSLNYLKELPIDKIKIDRSFINYVNENFNNNAIILAIIAMAKNMNIKVIMEGVERENQVEFLQANNCDQAQGYYYCKPINAEECAKFILQNQHVKS